MYNCKQNTLLVAIVISVSILDIRIKLVMKRNGTNYSAVPEYFYCIVQLSPHICIICWTIISSFPGFHIKGSHLQWNQKMLADSIEIGFETFVVALFHHNCRKEITIKVCQGSAQRFRTPLTWNIFLMTLCYLRSLISTKRKSCNYRFLDYSFRQLITAYQFVFL